MNFVLLHSVQSTGTNFISNILTSCADADHPRCSQIGDSQFRDREVFTFLEDYSFLDLKDWLRRKHHTKHCILWAHCTAINPLTDIVSQLDSDIPVVSGIRDPLLGMITRLSRMSKKAKWAYPLAWSYMHCFGPWTNLYNLWTQNKVYIFRVDLPEFYHEGYRQTQIRDLLKYCGLEYNGTHNDIASDWEPLGAHVHIGSSELPCSPILNKSQELLKAYYNRDIKTFECIIPDWLQALRVTVKRCLPMFDAYGYDFWWYKKLKGDW